MKAEYKTNKMTYLQVNTSLEVTKDGLGCVVDFNDILWDRITCKPIVLKLLPMEGLELLIFLLPSPKFEIMGWHHHA